MNYFKDFKNERFHDDNLIELLKILDNNNKLYLFETLINVKKGVLGPFIGGKRKRDFDVLLKFKNYNVVIETKVDSAEDYKNGVWQTERIFQSYKDRWKSKKKLFVFLTYGLSEYYIKEKENGEFSNGAFNTNFYHIKCSDVYHFINNSIKECSIDNFRINTWKNWLKFELEKRKDNNEYLKDVNRILKRYKKKLNLTDYPVNRMSIFLPEFTIPFYYELCKQWNKNNNEKIGRATLYPMGRGFASTNDSIINFTELNKKRPDLKFNGLLSGDENLYFEFNEDFNLHLKGAKLQNVKQIRNYLEENENGLKNGFDGVVERYKQGTYVLFEWDLDILSNSIEINIENIEKVILNSINLLKK